MVRRWERENFSSVMCWVLLPCVKFTWTGEAAQLSCQSPSFSIFPCCLSRVSLMTQFSVCLLLFGWPFRVQCMQFHNVVTILQIEFKGWRFSKNLRALVSDRSFKVPLWGITLLVSFSSRSKSRQGSGKYSSQTKSRPPSVLVRSLIGTQTYWLHTVFGCFSPQWQNWVVKAKTTWPRKPRIFTV